MAGVDFGINWAAGIATNLVSVVVKEAHYCYGFNNHVSDLGKEQDNLILTSESMLAQVRKAKANTKETSGDIQQQLKDAKDLIEKADKLKGKAEASKSCCHGVFPNWICRYIIGKQAARKKEAMNQLDEKLKQKLLFAHRLSLRPMATSEEFILFESRKEARDKILMALKDDEKIRIGLYGMGGCGKSSLLKEVHKAVEKEELFDKMAFAEVSNPPNIAAIQDSIANWLGLTFETEKNIPDRATRLCMRFMKDKKYLIILDDVWQVLKFDDIGIPLSKNCKVLLSTRQQHKCTLMDCQAVIYLSLLTKEEAWKLFQKHAGEIKSTFKEEAQEIADECHRLPVAIKAVASTLKGKPDFVWKEALETLKDRRRPLAIEKGLDDPYRCLKFSFDELKDAEEISLFLLCALFPKDSEIALETLIRFTFGLSIFQNVNSYQRARRKVRTAIEKFTDYCLLLQEEGQYIKMHDMLRALALREANAKTQVIMGPRQFLEAREKDYMKDTTRLYCHDLNKFPDQLNCPELEILLLSNDGGHSSEIPDTFFKEMIKLKVLAIENTSPRTIPNFLLPQSIDGLKKLRMLCLRGWTLDDISFLGKLEVLDTIELSYCVIKQLPKELAKLRQLKLLEVSSCRIGGNPYEVLARCSLLEELYFVENFLSEMAPNDHNVAELLHQICSSHAFERYHLEIGSSIDTLKDEVTSKFISINNFNTSTSNEAIKNLAQKLEVLFLEKIQVQCKSIIPDMIPTEGECNKLTEFVLSNSNNIECLIDTTNHQLYKARTVLSKLLKLKIVAMECLEALCRGPPPSGLFEELKELFIIKCSQLLSIGKLKLFNLKFIELEDCPKLTSLFTIGMAQTMVNLEVLKVTNCVKLKHIIKHEEDDIISVGSVFPKLKQISVKRCEHLECIIPASFAGGLSQLESLEIQDASELKHVFGKYNDEEDQNQNQSIVLPVLKVFNLTDLPNIISICPQNYHMFPFPDELPHTVRCPKLHGMSYSDAEASQQDGQKATEQARLLSMSGGEDMGISFATIMKKLVLSTAQEIRYCCRFRNFLEDFEEEKRRLMKTRERVLKQVEKATAYTHEPSGDLQQQLREAVDLISEVEMLEGKANAGKCRGVCPNWKGRYIVGKRLARMTEAMTRLNEMLESKLFFANRPLVLPTVMHLTSENFIFFESTKKVHNELLMALKDDQNISIGLYGMGGCGKTSLVKEVGKAVMGSKLFDEVVFAVVSNNPNIKSIQRTIADCLGLKLETHENQLERAARLSMRLNNGDKFLIILDDIWELLEFEDIGIPLGENCKVLLTTRRRDICTLMDCQKVIYLSVLAEEEALVLFQKHAGLIADRFKAVTQEITMACGRLPIAIIITARTLKDKPVVVWEEVFYTLRNGYFDIEEGMVYGCLKFSLDNLRNDEARSLLLLCALFPEDSKIALEMLIRFSFGLGMFEDVDSYERARGNVGAAIGELHDSCLLLPAEGQSIQMHDLVRDVALSIAKKTQVVMGPGQNLMALTERDYTKDTTRLYCHDINEFPDQLNCPKLEVLFVSNDGGCSYEFPDAFFKEIIELKVLAIIDTSVGTNPNLLLPQSIEGLKRLRTLCLRGWTLDNISILGKLEILDTIELSYCVMKELPKELAKLRQLKLLEVSNCRIKGNPYEVLARCPQLEELYFVENFLPEVVSNDQNVAELLHQIGSSQVFRRYHLEIGSSIDTLKDDLTSKFISINNFNASTLYEAIKDLAQKLEVLFMEKIQGDCKSIVPDMIPPEGECMNELNEVLLHDSDNLECLIDTTNYQLCHTGTVFPKLLKLKVEAMKCLEALCHGSPPFSLFKNLELLFIIKCSQLQCIVSVGKLNLCSLKFLKLEDCPMLTSVFTYSTAQTMVSLEVLKVRDCTSLKNIIEDKEEDDIISVGPVFPKLKQVCVERCARLECIIPASFACGLSQLESLEIEEAVQLTHVFGKHNHEEQNQNEFQKSIDLPILKVLKLINLPNITSICPQNYRTTMPSLVRVHI